MHMKKLLPVALSAALALGGLGALASTSASAGTTATSTGTTTTSSTQTTTTGSSSSGTLKQIDRIYLTKSVQTDLAEIKGAKTAMAKSRNAQVLAYAKTLVSQHTKLMQNTAKVARTFHFAIPTAPSAGQTTALAKVAKLSGTAFDQAFARNQIKGHQQAVAVNKNEINYGTNTTVEADAKAGLPMIEMHLKTARALVAAGK
jgi:putative membrane protein